MTALAEKIYNEALDLPAEDRLSLLDKLLHIAISLRRQTLIRHGSKKRSGATGRFVSTRWRDDLLFEIEVDDV
jgi:hypothetical protein